jgi:translation initiation factor 3 subunit B
VKKTRKNLREFSKLFDEQDFNKKNLANRAVVEQRRRLLDEWLAWRNHIDEFFSEEGIEVDEKKQADDEGEVIEEIVEEIIDETEEIVS